MILECRASHIDRSVTDESLILRVEKAQGATEFVPEHITLIFPLGTFPTLPLGLIHVRLGKQALPEPAPKKKLKPPVVAIYGDKLSKTFAGARLNFVRKTVGENPNWYEVFYGSTNVGYVRLLAQGWKGAVIVGGSRLRSVEDGKLDEAMLIFCKAIAQIVAQPSSSAVEDKEAI